VFLVVVQAEPAGTLDRTPTEREQMAMLRAFAADVFAVGANAVLLVPPLPAAIAKRAVQRCSELLDGATAPSLDALLSATAALQRAILEDWTDTGEGAPTDESKVELALDVCLFARFSGGSDL
jgi:hypothetical protein